jgi:hypothetical protein
LDFIRNAYSLANLERLKIRDYSSAIAIKNYVEGGMEDKSGEYSERRKIKSVFKKVVVFRRRFFSKKEESKYIQTEKKK